MVRAIDKWLLPYLLRRRPALPKDGPIHIMVAVCDHFEPLHNETKEGALNRLQIWRSRFPEMVDRFRDPDGRGPRQTFFYPVEQYDPDLLDQIAALCRETGSEVEIHLHHENDTPEGFEEKLERGKRDLAEHGLLSRDKEGAIRYGFVHGNWALNNSDPRGQGCGVDREIPILRRTGCYGDFTQPSAPHQTQTRTVNSIYYAEDAPRPKAHDRGIPASVAGTSGWRDRDDALLMIQGPLALNWCRRKWGLIPRVENGDLTGANPPTANRFQLWVDQRIGVLGRPDWIFVKLHTHGGIPQNFEMLLGEPMGAFHDGTTNGAGREFADRLRLHYLTAREMANIVHAAEDGCKGTPGEFRDFVFTDPS